jgi:Amt family ammonium transporter
MTTAVVLLVIAWCGITSAQEATTTKVAEAVTAMAPPAAPATPATPVDTGSTAWMLTSSALVLLMVPGLALFYGGMVRAKNVLNTFLSVMVCVGVIGLTWIIYGYAVAFPVVSPDTVLIQMSPDGGAGGSIISLLAFDKSLLFLNSFNHDWGRQLVSGDTVGAINTGVPELAFVMFQGKFAIITPALIVGALVERIRFGPLVLFMLLWSTFVYLPVAHWVWNVNGWLFQKGALDFAGGTVVHVLGGRERVGCVPRTRAAYRLRPNANAAAQPRPDANRRRPAVVRLVRVQRRFRSRGRQGLPTRRGRNGGPGLHQHANRRRRCRNDLDGRRMAARR